jgi:hypothetical protein
VKKDFTEISDYHDIVRAQADHKKAQAKKGVRDIKFGPNGEVMLTSVSKLKKQSQLNQEVKRLNAFATFVKSKIDDSSLSKDQKNGIKEIQKEYNKLYSIASKQL